MLFWAGPGGLRRYEPYEGTPGGGPWTDLWSPGGFWDRFLNFFIFKGFGGPNRSVFEGLETYSQRF